MSTQPEPSPLLEDPSLDADLHDLLSSARAGGPTEAELNGLAARLSPAVGVGLADLQGASLPQGTAPASTGTGAAAAAKTAVGKTALLKFTTSGVLKAVGLASLVGVGAVLVGLPTGSQAPEPAVAVVQEVVQPRLAPVPVAPAMEQPAVAAQATPEAEVTPAPAPQARPRGPAAKPSEIKLLKRAEGLRAEPLKALRVLRRHARLYPEGVLAQEREVLAIEALLAAGRRGEAQRRADRFAASHPGSAQLRRVRVLLAKEPAR